MFRFIVERFPSITSSSIQRILSHLGMLGAPATLIGLLCQLFGMSGRDTAACCVVATILIAIGLYRVTIDARLSSSAVLALFFGGLTLYFFTYENILLKDTGLVRFYKKSNDFLGEPLGKQLEEVQNELWFFGTTFHISADDQKKRILACLERGVNVRYLVFNPASSNFSNVAADFETEEDNLMGECDAFRRDLESLVKNWTNRRSAVANPGSLEIRMFDTTPRFRGYFFNPGGNGQAYLIPYINRQNSSDSPGYLFKGYTSGVAMSYFSGVKRLWQDSTPFHLAPATQTPAPAIK